MRNAEGDAKANIMIVIAMVSVNMKKIDKKNIQNAKTKPAQR